MKTRIDRRKNADPTNPWISLRQVAGSLRDPERRDRACRPLLETVEGRLLLSGGSPNMTPFALSLGPARATPLPNASTPEGTSSPGAYTPAQFQQAYGFNQTQFDYGVQGDGTGQTIAIVDAYIPYAAKSETSSKSWNLSVINVFSCSA